MRGGIGMELAFQINIQAGLFAGFPDRGALHGLAHIHESSRQGPARWRIAAPHQDNPVDVVLRMNDDVAGEARAGRLHGCQPVNLYPTR